MLFTLHEANAITYWQIADTASLENSEDGRATIGSVKEEGLNSQIGIVSP